MRYTRMPSHGMMITKITHIVLAPPPRSLLRKMSPRTQNRHMNQAKNKKNSNKASRNEPLSLNMTQPLTGPKGGSHPASPAASCDQRPKTSPAPDEPSTPAAWCVHRATGGTGGRRRRSGLVSEV